MNHSEQLLGMKKDFLVPCVYHFYKQPPVMVKAKGAYLFDSDGKKYLDCYSGVSVMNAGHSNPDIIDAATRQMGELQHTTTIYLSEPMLKLASMISNLVPKPLEKMFFCASGSEANESALLMSVLATKRNEFIHLKDGLHGRTKWAMSVTGLEMWKTDPHPLSTVHAVPGSQHPESISTIESILQRGTVAAVIAEPIQGNGGIIVPGDDYWPELRRICDKYGTLLIADEIQTAWNRTGRWFTTQHWNTVPDIITVAKALGNGFPIAACITTNAVASCYTRPGASTFGGNLVSCSAAIATLEFHKRHELGNRSQQLGNYLAGALRALQQRHQCIFDVRGIGLMIGVELRDSARNPDPILLDQVLEQLKDKGFLAGKTGSHRNVLTLMPPLIIEPSDLESFIKVLDQILMNAK